MKKITLLAAIVMVAGLSASCKKSYTCTCYDSNGNVSSSTSVSAYSTSGAAVSCAAKGSSCSL